MVREIREKIAEPDLKVVEQALEEDKKAMGEGGIARLRSATENIERALQKVADALYRQAPPAGAAAGAGAAGAGPGTGTGSSGGESGSQKKKDDVIDAEYVDVDESKRPN